MNDSNDSSNPTARATLRLKVTPRRTQPAIEAQPRPAQPASNKAKPGARWSDEHKDRMQSEMDALHR